MVDGSNLRGSLPYTGYRGIDAESFRIWCAAFGRPFIEWHQGAYPGLLGFHNVLRSAGVRVVAPTPKTLPNGHRKCDLDVAIAVAALRRAGNYPTVMLVSGDGDFEPLVCELVSRGLRVVIVAQRETLDPALVQHIDPEDHIPLANMLSYCGSSRDAA